MVASQQRCEPFNKLSKFTVYSIMKAKKGEEFDQKLENELMLNDMIFEDGLFDGDYMKISEVSQDVINFETGMN